MEIFTPPHTKCHNAAQQELRPPGTLDASCKT
jgi:hypothetical protein